MKSPKTLSLPITLHDAILTERCAEFIFEKLAGLPSDELRRLLDNPLMPERLATKFLFRHNTLMAGDGYPVARNPDWDRRNS